jgi:hypothetical protein
MKKLVFVFVLLTSFCFAQNSNSYKAVIVPLKFDFIQKNNQYRLSTLSKSLLINSGFTVFYANDILPKEYNDRCELLYYDIVKENAFLAIKLHVELKDCSGKIIFKSETGYTKEKDTELAYADALKKAFVSVHNLHYKYEKTSVASPVAEVKSVVATTVVSTISVPVIEKSTSDLLYAQATATGYQLVDASPRVVFKLYKTSRSDLFIAMKGISQGVLIQKENQWFFEYYESDILVSEKVAVKF